MPRRTIMTSTGNRSETTAGTATDAVIVIVTVTVTVTVTVSGGALF